MSQTLVDASPSHTVSATRFLRIADREAALDLLARRMRDNLAATLRIMRQAVGLGVRVYRLSSRLVPLLGHPQTRSWDFVDAAADGLAQVGAFARDHGMRVSLHPEHFTHLGSPRREVTEAAVTSLALYARMLDAMGLGRDAILVVHPGGLHGDRGASLDRFARVYADLPPQVASRLVLENDDRTFTARETLDLAGRIRRPMVLDLHHHRLNPGEDRCALEDLLGAVWQTWPADGPAPKVHLSSPRDATNPRAHADHVAVGDVIPFLVAAHPLDRDVDAMVEAKATDLAVTALMAELAHVPGVECLDGAKFAYAPAGT